MGWYNTGRKIGSAGSESRFVKGRNTGNVPPPPSNVPPSSQPMTPLSLKVVREDRGTEVVRTENRGGRVYTVHEPKGFSGSPVSEIRTSSKTAVYSGFKGSQNTFNVQRAKSVMSARAKEESNSPEPIKGLSPGMTAGQVLPILKGLKGNTSREELVRAVARTRPASERKNISLATGVSLGLQPESYEQYKIERGESAFAQRRAMGRLPKEVATVKYESHDNTLQNIDTALERENTKKLTGYYPEELSPPRREYGKFLFERSRIKKNVGYGPLGLLPPAGQVEGHNLVELKKSWNTYLRYDPVRIAYNAGLKKVKSYEEAFKPPVKKESVAWLNKAEDIATGGKKGWYTQKFSMPSDLPSKGYALAVPSNIPELALAYGASKLFEYAVPKVVAKFTKIKEPRIKVIGYKNVKNIEAKQAMAGGKARSPSLATVAGNSYDDMIIAYARSGKITSREGGELRLIGSVGGKKYTGIARQANSIKNTVTGEEIFKARQKLIVLKGKKVVSVSGTKAVGVSNKERLVSLGKETTYIGKGRPKTEDVGFFALQRQVNPLSQDISGKAPVVGKIFSNGRQVSTLRMTPVSGFESIYVDNRPQIIGKIFNKGKKVSTLKMVQKPSNFESGPYPISEQLGFGYSVKKGGRVPQGVSLIRGSLIYEKPLAGGNKEVYGLKGLNLKGKKSWRYFSQNPMGGGRVRANTVNQLDDYYRLSNPYIMRGKRGQATLFLQRQSIKRGGMASDSLVRLNAVGSFKDALVNLGKQNNIVMFGKVLSPYKSSVGLGALGGYKSVFGNKGRIDNSYRYLSGTNREYNRVVKPVGKTKIFYESGIKPSSLSREKGASEGKYSTRLNQSQRLNTRVMTDLKVGLGGKFGGGFLMPNRTKPPKIFPFFKMNKGGVGRSRKKSSVKSLKLYKVRGIL